MPKKLPEDAQNADPVRSRLATMVSQAAAPSAAAAVAVEPKREPEEKQKAERSRKPASGERQRRAKASQLRDHRSSNAAFLEVRKTKFTHDEIEGNDEIVEVIGRLVGGRPSQSSVTRVLWYLLRLAEESMKLRAGRAPQLKRPPNGFGFEMVEYEQQLAQFLLKGIKDVEL
jgi:hypothetical protein